MPYPTKIATCCYCTARTLLKPTARDGHELACGSCGAPLHEMKWLKKPEAAAPPKRRPSPAKNYAKPTFKWPKAKRRKKPKRRERLFRKVLEELWDFAEDIFD